jgi:hypothetical protein
MTSWDRIIMIVGLRCPARLAAKSVPLDFQRHAALIFKTNKKELSCV